MSQRKAPAKRRSVVEDEDPIDVEAPTTQPQTSKFLKRAGHGTNLATSAGVASCFKLRIHACVSQKDTEEFKHGEETAWQLYDCSDDAEGATWQNVPVYGPDQT